MQRIIRKNLPFIREELAPEVRAWAGHSLGALGVLGVLGAWE